MHRLTLITIFIQENRDLLDTISSDDSRLREEHVTHRNTVNSTQRIIRRVNNGVVSMEGSISVLESNVTALEGLGNETVRRLLDAKEKVGKAEDQLNGLLEDLRRAGVDNLRQRGEFVIWCVVLSVCLFVCLPTLPKSDGENPDHQSLEDYISYPKKLQQRLILQQISLLTLSLREQQPG